MLKLTIFDYKIYEEDKNGNMIIDLTRSSINPFINVGTERIISVPEDYVMRPDLLSIAAYGTADYLDLILKYNGISNPFSLYEGQVIAIPDISAYKGALKYPEHLADIEDPEYADFKILNENDSLSERAKNLADKKENNLLPPNVNSEGEENVTVSNGEINFGGNSAIDPVCGTTTTRARAKARLINNLIR